MSPGAISATLLWIVASAGFTVYVAKFNSYDETYGSLGGVIILLTWFYITGLMLLLGAEVNSEIQAAVAEKKLKDSGAIPQDVDAEPKIAAGEPLPLR